MRTLLAFAALLAGCLRGGGTFQCASNDDCTSSSGAGRCEVGGFCSFTDSSCASGNRFGSLSGPFAGECVAPVDAGVDAPLDAFVPRDARVTPTFVNENHAFAEMAATLTYQLTVAPGTDRYLLVSVQLATDCNSTTTPTVTAVTYAGVSLTQVATLLGIGCGATSTRSEQWGLIAAPTGSANVAITISAMANSLHSGAMVFTNVNQLTPVRNFASMRGPPVENSMSTITVASVVGDLVVNTVGFGGAVPIVGGGGIVGPDAPATTLFIQNVSGGDTLDNSAACSMPGDTLVTASWEFADNDEWQTISSSLEPDL